MELKFFWRSQRLDTLRIDALGDAASLASLFVSIQAPLQLARAEKHAIEDQLRIVDDRGASYAIDVEPTSGAAARYGMINGYVWPRPASAS